MQETALHAALAQVAATMYSQMRPSPNDEREWADAFRGHNPPLQGEAEEPGAGG